MKRDLIGYGGNPTRQSFANGKRLAISIVVNYEEGSEYSHAMGDSRQDTMFDWGAYPTPPNIRNLAAESVTEYGSRVGVWRLLDLLQNAQVKSTFFACALAFEQNPKVAETAIAAGHEICSHGYRWEEVFMLSEDQEREHIRLAIESFKNTCGKRPVGWYCRYGPSIHTRRLLIEEGGFIYDSDAYNDDVPYFTEVSGKKHLVVPYTPDANDFNFWLAPGFVTADDFNIYLKDSFDILYKESEKSPRLMSIGLHPRIIGRPGKIKSLSNFIDYAKQQNGVWFATREEIARDWLSIDG